jgi:predicted RNA-binding protein with PUA-like domain
MARCWLLKSDPETFGWSHLAVSPEQTTRWDGVRNYQARNLLRDALQLSDPAFFYHSQEKPPAIVGIVRIVRAGYPDPTQFDPSSPYHDPRSDRAAPRWYAVDVRLERELERAVTLPELRGTAGLESMVLLRRSRLSVQPVTAAEWKIVLRLAAGGKA